MSGKAIPTNLRTIRLLEAVAAAGEPVTATRLNAELGLPKQTLHRLCATLVEDGLLERHGTSLGPGPRMTAMAAGVMETATIRVARHQILRDVAASVGETVNFVVPEPQGMTYRERVETQWAFRIQLPVGSHVPFHCTASGKTWLASLPRAQRRRTVHALTLAGLTPHTITDRDALMDELARIESDGHAIDNEEFIEGMVALAVPVRDAQGRFVAAVAFHGPCQRLDLDTLLAGRPVLANAATRLADACYGR